MIMIYHSLTETESPKKLFSTRILAVQALYANEVCHDLKSYADLKKEFIEYHQEKYDIADLDKDILDLLLRITIENKESIDKEIAKFLNEDWHISRLPEVVLAIFRVSFSEIVYLKNRNHSFLIYEYLQVAKSLNYQDDIKFINAVLDGFAKKDWEEVKTARVTTNNMSK